jgi:hypothetical protein
MAIAYVSASAQSHTTSGGATSIATAYAQNVGSGSLLVVMSFFYNGSGAPTISTPTDTLGTTYAAVDVQQNFFTGRIGLRMYYGIAPSWGANTVTQNVTGQNITFGTMFVAEFTGVQTSSPLEAHQNDTGTSASPTATSVSASNGSVVVNCISNTDGISSSVFTPGTNYNLIKKIVDGTVFLVGASEYQIVPSAGGYTPNWTTDNNEFGMQTGAFLAAGAADVLLGQAIF